MRRLALSVLASCGIAVLAACAGPGYGFSGTVGNSVTPDAIIFQNGSASVDTFKVSPNGSAPLLISAVATKGTGITATVIPDVVFQWSAAYAPAGTTVNQGVSPSGNTVCPAPPAAPINSLLQFGGGGAAYPFFNNQYTQLTAQANTTPPVYTQQTSQIYFAAPFNAGPPATQVGGTYCVFITATHGASGRTGTVTVLVSN